MHRSKLGFLLRIFLCSQTDKHPKNNLAKFGYILNMKVGEKKNKIIQFLATYWNLSLKITLQKFGKNSSIKDALVQTIVGGSLF
jgi:hypothetical protein